MRSSSFLLRSLLYSLPVGLRMIPILLAAGYILFMIATFLESQPVALLFVFAVINIPLSIFIFLCSVRCGLVQMKASGPPMIKKLLGITLKFMRFNLPIYILCIKLIGIGGSIVLVKFLVPEVWNTLFEDFRMSMLTRPLLVLEAIANVPMLIIPIFALANAVAIAVMGTNIAAMADTAAYKGPNHDQIWGLAAQFTRLLMLGLLVLVLPWLIVIAQFGNPMVGVGALFLMSEEFFIGLPLYNAWSSCVMAAGMALAYVYTKEDLAEAKILEQAEFDGPQFDRDELRELRASRQKKMLAARA